VLQAEKVLLAVLHLHEEKYGMHHGWLLDSVMSPSWSSKEPFPSVPVTYLDPRTDT
jgi:hypothetical protein